MTNEPDDKNPRTLTWDEVMGSESASPVTDTVTVEPTPLGFPSVAEAAEPLISPTPTEGWPAAYAQCGMAFDAERQAAAARARGETGMHTEYKRQAAEHREIARQAVAPELDEEMADARGRVADA